MVSEYQRPVSRACESCSISRTSFYYQEKPDRNALVEATLTKFSEEFPRWGFQKLFDKLRLEGYEWNHKRVYRIYCQLGLNKRRHFKKRLPKRKKEKLQAPEAPNEVWALDFTSDNLITGKSFRTLNLIDEFNREALSIEVDTSLPATRVVRVLNQVLLERGAPKALRLDNGPEFISKALEKWANENKVELKFIQPGKPTQNCYIERFNGTYRFELLSPNLFKDLEQVREDSYKWMIQYNEKRPHQALKGMTPNLYHQKWKNDSLVMKC